MTINSAATETLDDTDAVLETLANGRRRMVLRSLEEATGNERTVDELVDDVVEGSSGDEPAEQPSEHRIFTELYHNHLPALEEMEMIVHDREKGVVWADADEATLELLALIEQYEAAT